MIYNIKLINTSSSLKVPERREKCLQISFRMKGKFQSTPSGREWTTAQTTNIGGDRMYPGINILSLPNSNSFLGGRKSGWKSGQLPVLRMENYPWGPMNHKLANGMNMWKWNGNTTISLFSLLRSNRKFFILTKN